MPLTAEQISEAKRQLAEQIQHLPPEQKAEAQKQIDSLSPEAIESMISQQQSQQQSPYRMIVSKELKAVIIDENSEALAVLEIMPISKGHTIIIPKNKIEDESKIPKSIHQLSEEVSKKLIDSLKAKSTKILSEKKFGEAILNIIPIYDKPLDLESERKKSSLEELEEIKKQINVEKIERKPEKIKVEKKKPQKPLKLPRRIP